MEKEHAKELAQYLNREFQGHGYIIEAVKKEYEDDWMVTIY